MIPCSPLPPADEAEEVIKQATQDIYVSQLTTCSNNSIITCTASYYSLAALNVLLNIIHVQSTVH